MMEAARTSETSVDNYFTRQYIPEDKSELHTRRRENLKSHKAGIGSMSAHCWSTIPVPNFSFFFSVARHHKNFGDSH
jgi:hypothetical protein